MGDVLQFRPQDHCSSQELLYWKCDCGSVKFYHLSDGSLECEHCETIQDGQADNFYHQE